MPARSSCGSAHSPTTASPAAALASPASATATGAVTDSSTSCPPSIRVSHTERVSRSSSRPGCATCGRTTPERFLTFGAEVFGIEPVDPEVDDLSDIDEEITPERAVHDAVEATIDELQEFFVSMGMPSTLGELGIEETDIDRLIRGLRINRGERFGTFQSLTLDDARAIYKSAL